MFCYLQLMHTISGNGDTVKFNHVSYTNVSDMLVLSFVAIAKEFVSASTPAGAYLAHAYFN